MKELMQNKDIYKTLDLFRNQLELEADSRFGYAVSLIPKYGKTLLQGVGASPHKAVEDLAKKWEKG